MSRKGDCSDNTVVENSFGTDTTELLDRRPWATRHGARRVISEYMELFYNTQRLHSQLGYVGPADYERNGFCAGDGSGSIRKPSTEMGARSPWAGREDTNSHDRDPVCCVPDLLWRLWLRLQRMPTTGAGAD